MAIQVPKDIVPFMELLTGSKMPDGDEDKMFHLAQVHHELTQRLEALPQILNDCVNYTANSFTGPAAQQYRDAMAPFIDSKGIDYIKAMSGQAAMIAEFTSETATQIQYAKYMIIAQCIELLLEMAIALALAFFTGGASILEYLAGEAVAKFFMQSLIARVIGMIVMHEIISVGMGAAMDSMIQWIQLMEGTRDEFDTNSLFESMKFGAIQGLISLPMGGLGGLFGKGLGNLFSKGVTKDLADVIGKAGGNKALGKDLADVLGGALTRGNGPLGDAAKNTLVKDIGKAFADHVGTGAQKTLAREAGEKWARELIDNFGKPGLTKSLRGALDPLEGILSADLMKALARGLPDNMARDLLRGLGNHLGQGLTEGASGVLAEGVYNAIFSEDHAFETSWLTFGSGVVGGRLGHLAEAGGERMGLGLREKVFGAPPEANGAPPKLDPGAVGGKTAGTGATTEATAEGPAGATKDDDAGAEPSTVEETLSVLPLDEVTDADWDTYWGTEDADSGSDSRSATGTGDEAASPESPGTPAGPVPVAPTAVVTASAPPAATTTTGAAQPSATAPGGPRPAPTPTASTGTATADGRSTTTTTGTDTPGQKVATTDTSSTTDTSTTETSTGSTTPDVPVPERPATESAGSPDTAPDPGTPTPTPTETGTDTGTDDDGELQYLDVGDGTTAPPPPPPPTQVATATVTASTDPPAAPTGTLLGAATDFAPAPAPVPAAAPPERRPLTNSGRWNDTLTEFVTYEPSTNVHRDTPEGRIGLTPRSAEQWLVESGIEVRRGGILDALPTFLYRTDVDLVYRHDEAARFRADLAAWSTEQHVAGQQKVLEAVNELAGTITGRYPPAEHVFLGLGRSPAAVIAALQLAGPEVSASSMPLSDFRPGPTDFTGIHYAAAVSPTGEPAAPPSFDQRRMLFEHFAEFLPEIPPGKDLVLIDYTQSGRSLFAAEGLLGEYFTSIGRTDVKVKAFAIHQDIDSNNIKGTYAKIAAPRSLLDLDAYVNTGARKEWSERVELHPLTTLGVKPTKEKLFGEAFKNEAFDGLAEHGSYKLLNTDPETFEATRPRRADGMAADGYHEVLKRALDGSLVFTPDDVPATTTTTTVTTSSQAGELIGTAHPGGRTDVPGAVFHDPAQEQAHAQLVARDYPWLGEVNPYRDSNPEARTNCLLTAIATDLSLAEGVGHQAPPSDASPAEHLANYQGRPPLPVTSYAQLTDLMHQAGPGARGMVVIGAAGDPVAHVVNVVHDGDRVVFLDGQTGGLARLASAPDRLELLPTRGDFESESVGPDFSGDAARLGAGGERWTEGPPTVKQWKDASGQFGRSRSQELAAIDQALAAYHDSGGPTRLAALGTVQHGIEEWQATKRPFRGGPVGSSRADVVSDLHRSIDAERTRLTLEQRRAVPGFDTPLPPGTAYDRVSVHAAGAVTDVNGAFTRDSQATHETVRATMPNATEAQVRIEMLRREVSRAAAEFRTELAGQENPDAVLGVFTAPEWYFKRPGIPFTRGEKEMIVTAAVALSAEHPGLLIVPGSTVWSEPAPGGNGTVLKAGSAAALNGRLVHETTKLREGSDVTGYTPNREERRNLDQATAAAAEAAAAKLQRDFNSAGESVTDTAVFTVGGRRIALEICLDHHNGRARGETEALPALPRADLQIVVAHGMMLKNSALREGGIAVFNDSSELSDTAAALRSVHRWGAGTARFERGTTEESRLETDADLTTMSMGVFPLPEAAPQLLGSAWSTHTLSSALPTDAPPQHHADVSLADDAFLTITGGGAPAPRPAVPDAPDVPGGTKRRAETDAPDVHEASDNGEPTGHKRPFSDGPQSDRDLTGRGLVPPTPEQHRAVADHVAALHLPEGALPPVTTDLLGLINPTESTANCLEANLALWDTLDGNPRATGTLPGSTPERLAVWALGRSQGPAWHYGAGPQGLDSVLTLVHDGGPGTRALVLVARGGEVGHAMTVLHGADGRLQLVDPQRHDVRDAQGPATEILPEVGADASVWAHVRDADGGMLKGDGHYDESLYHDHETGAPAHEFGMLPGTEGQGLGRIFDRRPGLDVPEWNETAARFERLVARRAYELSGGPNNAVTQALTKLSTVLNTYYGTTSTDADAPAPGTEGIAPGLKAFLNDDPTSAGQINHSGLTSADARDMLASGNPREQYTAFYNAAYYEPFNAEGLPGSTEHRGLKKALIEIMQQKDWERAERLGLKREALEEYGEYLFGWKRSAFHTLARFFSPQYARLVEGDPFALGNLIPFRSGVSDLTDMIASQSHRTARPDYRQVWAPDKLTVARLNAEAVLSSRELAYLREHQEVSEIIGLHHREFLAGDAPTLENGLPDVEALMQLPGAVDVKFEAEPSGLSEAGEQLYTFERVHVITEMTRPTTLSPDVADAPVRFIEGAARYTLDADAGWSREMAERGNRTIAGISGTTTRMLSAFQWLDVPGVSQADFVIGLIGWMGLHNDHSLYEILRGAQMAGFEGVDGQKFDLTDAASMYHSLTALGPGFSLAELRSLTGDLELRPLPNGLDADERKQWEDVNAVRGAHGLLPHETVYREYARREQKQGGFQVLGDDDFDHIATVFDELDEGVRHKGTVLSDWMSRNNMTSAALRASFSEAHALALRAYTGPDHEFINLAVEATLGKAAPILSLRGRMEGKLKELLDKRLEGGTSKGVQLFFSDDVVRNSIREYRNLAKKGNGPERMAEIREELHATLRRKMPDIVKEASWHADMLGEALRNLPGYTGPTLWRGDWAAGALTQNGLLTLLRRAIPSTYSGERFSYDFFASSSRSREVALNFSASTRSQMMFHQVLLDITPNGQHGRDIHPFAVTESEEEVLFLPGAEFKIISRDVIAKDVKDKNGVVRQEYYEVIKVEEV
ncbi:toxin glutamine deamidase domain-containing protein [Streptomyces sp. NPDC006430]|uniref:toxin glutamine deamidase domain-containing protein n=1 Tax=Streptomyces sp. NPDC006430 TaxID=3154299 RepID=UPI0033A8E5D4